MDWGVKLKLENFVVYFIHLSILDLTFLREID